MKYLLAFFLTFFSISSFSQLSMPPGTFLLTGRELGGTINLKYKGATQSGFLYKASDSACYIITAKHLLIQSFIRISKNNKTFFDSIPVKEKGTIALTISFKGNWQNIKGTVLFHSDSSVDIIMIKTNIIMDGNAYKFSSTGVLLGQDCYFLGFPLGLKQSYKIFGNIEFDQPLIRKGIISGVQEKEGHNVFFLDAHNTYGFSGGPVIYYNYVNQGFYVLGVTSSYLAQKNKKIETDGRIIESEENSGVMLVYDISDAFKIFK